jgi:N-acetylneuraminic acid mutarotase
MRIVFDSVAGQPAAKLQGRKMNRIHRLNWNDITENCLPTLVSPRQFFKKLHLLLGIAVLGLLYGCGGGSDTGSDPGPGAGVNPPTGLVYAVSSASHAQHQAITPNVPRNSGGKITDYSVEPALPAGLVLDAVSGVISGTPVEAAPAVIHTVTGSNAHGAATAYLQIEVTAAVTAPTLLRYKENPVSYPVNADINPNLPYTEGGAVTQFSASPALPDGLQLDPSTGVISGASSTAKPAATYVISASNAVGAVSRALIIGIADSLQPPDNLTYSQPVAIYPQGKVVAPNLPTATGGAITEFSVHPPLPEGLSLNTDSGEITGTPTTLQEEKLYTITGNNQDGGTLATITIAVVSSGAFEPGASLATSRYYHTATKLDDGKILVAGGRSNVTSGWATTELYDSENNNWKPAGTMKTARYLHTATLLKNGKVLVTGGLKEGNVSITLGTVELYDPVADSWQSMNNMKQPRAEHTATLLPDGNVLVVGGGYFGTDNTAEIYDPSTDSWEFTKTLMENSRTRGHTAVLLKTGKVLVAGGLSNPSVYSVQATAELYDPDADTWTSTDPMTGPRRDHAMTELENGEILVAGGYDSLHAADYQLKTAELYDPNLGEWRPASPMNYARPYHSQVRLEDGNVLAAGGYGATLMAELYNSNTNTWERTGNLNTSHAYPTAIALKNGKVLIAGGFTNRMELYTP